MGGQPSEPLAQAIARVRERISRLRGDRNFNEQNTKASLIVPVLQALGWDTNDSDEVHWEYKPKPKHNPVDFALLLQRTPCLFLEAKALRESLADDKFVAQVLTYASVSGVQWVVLSNGDEYRIYNANAPVPVEEKLFRTVKVSTDTPSIVMNTLSLLSQANLQEKKIDRVWGSQFDDRQVGGAIEEIFNPAAPDKALVRIIRNHLHGKLADSAISASLRRARLVLNFPEEPETALPARSGQGKSERRKRVESPDAGQSEAAGEKGRVTLQAVILEGLLPLPAKLVCVYRGQTLSAKVEEDGAVTFEGVKYTSPSAAGGAARMPFFKGRLKGTPPATNGWTFWQVSDPVGGSLVALDALRDRFLQKKSAEAGRFNKRNA